MIGPTRTSSVLLLAVFVGAGCRLAADSGPANELTDAERAAGWRLLWDGRGTGGWRSIQSPEFPTNRWAVRDGVLTVRHNPNAGFEYGVDLVTAETFTNFELVLDFRLTPGANSGVKYFARSNLDPATGKMIRPELSPAIGCEYQLLDDDRHPDAKAGRDGNRKLGSLYDLVPSPAAKPLNPVGQWNTARIVVNGRRVEHWLNGVKLLACERDTPAFHELVARSKFKNVPGFGDWPDGRILLQDHGDEVSYRNIRVKVLP